MARAARRALAALLVALPLAGCANDEPAVALETLSLGTIAGVVTDVGLKPLEGASVRVDGMNATATSDATGAFTLQVPPGEYLVLATFEGHRGGAMRAAPGPGETARLAFALPLIPVETPQVMVQEGHGLLACGATFVAAEQTHSFACGTNDPNQRETIGFPVQDTHGLAGAVVEVVWAPHAQASEHLRIEVTSGTGDTATFLSSTEGTTHVVIPIPGRVLEGAVKPGDTLTVGVAPAGSLTDEEANLDAGAVFQQPFTVYLSVFYYAAPPAGYTVVQSAA